MSRLGWHPATCWRRQSYHSQTSDGSRRKAWGVASCSGRCVRQSPPGPRNVGMPLAAETPAPLITVIRDSGRSRAARRSTADGVGTTDSTLDASCGHDEFYAGRVVESAVVACALALEPCHGRDRCRLRLGGPSRPISRRRWTVPSSTGRESRTVPVYGPVTPHCGQGPVRSTGSAGLGWRSMACDSWTRCPRSLQPYSAEPLKLTTSLCLGWVGRASVPMCSVPASDGSPERRRFTSWTRPTRLRSGHSRTGSRSTERCSSCRASRERLSNQPC